MIEQETNSDTADAKTYIEVPGGTIDNKRWILTTQVSGYTFTDEMWRTKTVYPQRLLRRETPDGPLKHARRQSRIAYSWSPTRKRWDETIATEAAKLDDDLWCQTSSVAEYEERKRQIQETHRSKRESFLKSSGEFLLFQHLPYDLRVAIWELAISTQPTPVRIEISEQKMPAMSYSSCCITPPYVDSNYSAIARLPPLMLVNRETHDIAAKRYRRSFTSLDQTGGVLAAYPTDLIISWKAFKLGAPDDIKLVRKLFIKDILLRFRVNNIVGMLHEAKRLEKLTLHFNHPNWRRIEDRIKTLEKQISFSINLEFD